MNILISDVEFFFQANIGKDVKSSKFVRALVTALVESQVMSKLHLMV